jgi:hypothetical protein
MAETVLVAIERLSSAQHRSAHRHMKHSPTPASAQSALDTTEPPCDFDAFVAQRRGISYQRAERLVRCWLKHYRPRIDAQPGGATLDIAHA